MKEHRQGWRVYIRAICGWINSRRYRRNTQKFLKRFFYHRLLRYTQILFLRISAISAWCIFYGLYGLKDFSPILLSSIKLFFFRVYPRFGYAELKFSPQATQKDDLLNSYDGNSCYCLYLVFDEKMLFDGWKLFRFNAKELSLQPNWCNGLHRFDYW